MRKKTIDVISNTNGSYCGNRTLGEGVEKLRML